MFKNCSGRQLHIVENRFSGSLKKELLEQTYHIFHVLPDNIIKVVTGLISMPAFTFRSVARLPFAGRIYTDPKCQRGIRNFSSHGVRLRVSLHAEGKPSRVQ